MEHLAMELEVGGCAMKKTRYAQVSDKQAGSGCVIKRRDWHRLWLRV